MNNPTSFLHCFDENGEICIETFFAYRQKQDEEAVSHANVRLFLHNFCIYGATVMQDRYVRIPKNKEEIERCMQVYSKLGLNGCIGSMDATHIQGGRIPAALAQAHISFKLKHPARSYNITVDHKRRILFSTRGFPGRYNDQSIVRYDDFFCQISDNAIGNNTKFWLYYYDSASQTVKQQSYSSHMKPIWRRTSKCRRRAHGAC